MNKACLLVSCLYLLVTAWGCTGSNDDGGDAGNTDADGTRDNDTGGDKTSEPHVVVTPVFSDSTTGVFSERMSWSADDALIAFAGSPADIYRVAAEAGASPVKVTGRTDQDWYKGGYDPSYLTDGRIAYYVGAIDSDYDMHIMVATAGQENNQPEPVILQRYNGSDVGLDTNTSASPAYLSVSGAGDKAIAGYGGLLWILDWSSASLQATAIGAAGEHTFAMLSSDGTRVTYVATSGKVAWMNLDGSGQTELDTGSSPTWSRDDMQIGYLDATAANYQVYDLASQLTRSYKLPAGSYIDVALSSDASRIAIRTFGGANDGIAIGQLVD